MANVLVVAMPSAPAGTSLSRTLEAAGHLVTWCPGPQPPRYVCIGGCGRHCPLVGGSDVVVLDCWLGSDLERRGVPSWHLLRYYRQRGIPVLALIGPDGMPGPLNDEGVTILPASASASEVAAALAELVERAPALREEAG